MNKFKNHFVRICREIAKPNLKEFNRLKSLSKCSSLVTDTKVMKKINFLSLFFENLYDHTLLYLRKYLYGRELLSRFYGIILDV